ncbi:MAG TPA: ABC transporter permease [Cyclobacteriaceae bacterium]|nr:ABC transporter permease [Cyclobacteriaceae bacterium]
MLLNYLKLSLRLMARSPYYTFISVSGLTIGIISFYVLWFYAESQLDSDKYHANSERIVRICTNWDWVDNGVTGHSIAGGMRSSVGPRVKEDFPEVEDVTRILIQNSCNVEMVKHDLSMTLSTVDRGEERIFKESRAIYADRNLFEFFSIPMLMGNASNVLDEGNSIVLSSSTATRYFGKADPVGKLLKLSDSVMLKVTGVFEDLPDNTHLGFDMVISNTPHLNAWNTSFVNFTNTYVRLRESNIKSFEARLNQHVDKYWGDLLKHYWNVQISMFAQPLSEVSFSQSFNGDIFPQKSKPFLYTLQLISLAILFMAWANHVNLSIIRTVKRFKEIAARKVSGAAGRDMIKQFMIESVAVYALAILLAFTVTQLIERPFESTFNISIIDFISMPFYGKLVLAAVILVGIVTSGLYPVYSASRLNAASLFKMAKPSKEKRYFTTSLSIIQFSAAVVVIIVGLVVALQLNNVLSKTSDADKAVMIIESPVHKPVGFSRLASLFREKVSRVPGVHTASAANYVTGDPSGVPDFEAKRINSEHHYGMMRDGIDENYLSLFNFRLLAGRNFVKDDRADAVIITRYAAERLGFKDAESAVGAQIHISLGIVRSWQTVEIIGVVSDVNYGYHYKVIGEGSYDIGLVFTYGDKLFPYLVAERIALQLHPSKVKEVTTEVEKIFMEMFPGNVFMSYFHDDLVNQIYENEKIIRNQIVLFTTLAITIACIGLLGIISFEVIDRKKEIGIRKVLGARLVQIGLLLIRTTGYQILFAVVISIPVAWYLSNQYIDKFSRQIQLSWWHFAAPISLLALVLISTIISTVWKAARSNPVEALKDE